MRIIHYFFLLWILVESSFPDEATLRPTTGPTTTTPTNVLEPVSKTKTSGEQPRSVSIGVALLITLVGTVYGTRLMISSGRPRNEYHDQVGDAINFW
jgi:hypothetical protein